MVITVSFQVAELRIRECGQMPPSRRGPKCQPLLDVPSYWVIPVSPRLLARTEKMPVWFTLAMPGPSCPGHLSVPCCHRPPRRDPRGEGPGCRSPMISMKICFQCSQVWKPRRRAEPSGNVCSCCCRKLSQRR